MADPAATWYVEEGIGEERAVLVESGQVVAARLYWPGALTAGQIEEAHLIARTAGSSRGTARFASGEEALVGGLPRAASEGSALRLKITRAAIREAGRTKLAHARPTEEELRPPPSLAEALQAEAGVAELVTRFPVSGWEDLIADAFAREVAFAGGSLLLSATPAMTLIDVDGTLPPPNLALAAIPAIAGTLRLLDIGGSVGIDFPTLSDKADRRRIDQALQDALRDWPHERTAINGFGFVQLVARAERPSILHRVSFDAAGAAARMLLRRAETVSAPGALLLTCHPAVHARLEDRWLQELARRSGRPVRVATDPTLALEAAFAQAVPL